MKQKLACYLVLAALTAFLASADKVTIAQVQTFIWWDWLRFIGGILLPVGVTWRAYIDQSVSRDEQEKGKTNG